MNRWLRPLVVTAVLAPLGCGSSEKTEPGPNPKNVDRPRTIATDPDRWKPAVESSKDSFVLTDSIEIRDTAENAEVELKERAHRRAVELTIRDLVRDDRLYAENENEVRRVFLDQFQRYVESYEVVQNERFGDGRQLGLKARVKVARDRLASDLQSEGLFRKDQGAMRVILVVRKPASPVEKSDPQAASYLDDVGENLSRSLLERGFQPKLWRDVRLSLAEQRDGQDQKIEQFLRTYVEDSEWRKPDDERYELPLIYLRGEGRLLIGFRFLELERNEGAYTALLRADAYDLLNQASLGYETEAGRETIGDRSLVEARQALVDATSARLMKKLLDKLQSFLDQQRRLKRKSYRLTFEGYDERELARIESILAGVLTEDVSAKNDGNALTVSANVARDPIPVKDELERMLKRLGLESRPARREDTKVTFVKAKKP